MELKYLSMGFLNQILTTIETISAKCFILTNIRLVLILITASERSSQNICSDGKLKLNFTFLKSHFERNLVHIYPPYDIYIGMGSFCALLKFVSDLIL